MSKTTISIVQGNITTRAVDAIVNAANGTLLGGGGVDGAIHKAAGPDLLEECRELGGCATGQAKVTKPYGIRQVRNIIHTVGPIYGRDSRGAELLAGCYTECLSLARIQGCRSIAFPSISTGAYGYPIEAASEIALRAIGDYLGKHPGDFDLVEIVTFSKGDYRMYLRTFQRIISDFE
ncbi:MAG TPA: macro domain-containing protein [Edaphobacter sp.]|nr:macro domain-containing protein [Edaphobacter sp.]